MNKFVALAFGVYLISGNILRTIEIPGMGNNVLISEVFLYLIALLYFIMNGKKFINLKIITIFLLIIFSFLIGTLKYGIRMTPFIYALRLIFMIWTGYTIGNVFYSIYNFKIHDFFRFIVNTYLILTVISFIIYMVFPNSVDLWNLLNTMGINFIGDPHINRLISVYFDPNFYGVIVIIPLISALYLYYYTGLKRYLVSFLFFNLANLLTISRSGLMTLVLVYLLMIVRSLFVYKRIHKRTFLLVMVIIISSVLLFPFIADEAIRLIDRINNVSDDDSAIARLYTFDLGVSLLKDNYLLGTGYNYLSIEMEKINRQFSLDSSLLSIFVNFGIFISALFLIIFVFFIVDFVKNIPRSYFERRLFIDILFYIFVVVVFSSNFNNIIFYQFWLIPIIVVVTYMYNYGLEIKNEKNNY